MRHIYQSILALIIGAAITVGKPARAADWTTIGACAVGLLAVNGVAQYFIRRNARSKLSKVFHVDSRLGHLILDQIHGPSDIVVSPSGNTVAIVSSPGNVVVFDRHAERVKFNRRILEVGPISWSSPLHAIFLSESDLRLVHSYNGTYYSNSWRTLDLNVDKLGRRQPRAELFRFAGEISGLIEAVAPDGSFVLERSPKRTGPAQVRIRHFDPLAKPPSFVDIEERPFLSPHAVQFQAFSPDSSRVAYLKNTKTKFEIAVRSVAGMEREGVCFLEKGESKPQLQFLSNDPTQIVLNIRSGDQPGIYLWNMLRRTQIAKVSELYPIIRGEYTSFAVSPNDKEIVIAEPDGTLKLFLLDDAMGATLKGRLVAGRAVSRLKYLDGLITAQLAEDETRSGGFVLFDLGKYPLLVP